jgi:hypothetical protein
MPFTYLFDRFCHYLETEATSDEYPVLNPSDNIGRQRYFREFVRGLPDTVPLDELSRQHQLEISRRVEVNGLDTLSDREVRDFFLRIHAVKYGSGAGHRENVIIYAARDEPHLLRDLLELLRDECIPVEHRVEYALTDRTRKGVGKRIKYLGPSCIGEIPGWLIHGHEPSNCKYPIVNGKFVRTLYRLGIYKPIDVEESCFTSDLDA